MTFNNDPMTTKSILLRNNVSAKFKKNGLIPSQITHIGGTGVTMTLNYDLMTSKSTWFKSNDPRKFHQSRLIVLQVIDYLITVVHKNIIYISLEMNLLSVAHY